MTGGEGRDVQRAIAFLSSLEPGDVERWDSPVAPADYAALVRMASDRGFELNPPALRAAFALIIRARLVAGSGRPA